MCPALIALALLLLGLAALIWIRLRSHRVREGMGDPVDAVITYVDASDPEWRASMEQFRATDWTPDFNLPDSAVINRFRTLNELKYCLRSIESYAPWIRNVHLVVAGPSQLPSWLNVGSPRLRIVEHAQIIPSAYLPTFNSHVIEAHLHRIRDLSETFLYFNDDIFLGRLTKREDFIEPNGQLRFFPDGGKGKSAAPTGTPGKKDSSHQAMWRNVNAWLDRRYKAESRSVMIHTPGVLSRSLMETIWAQLGAELDETSRHRFRDMRDYGMTCALHPYVAWYEGVGKRVEPVPGIGNAWELVGDAARDDAVLESMRKGKSLTFGINDSDPSESPATKERLVELLEAMYPRKGEFER